MITTGWINWPKAAELGWTARRDAISYVWAYWPVEHVKQNLDLFDQDAPGWDWFLADQAANISGIPPLIEGEFPSPNYPRIEDSPGVLAAVCLGTCDRAFHSSTHDGYFWAGVSDLSQSGRRLVSTLSGLYHRQPVLVTYMQVRPIRQAVPGAALDKATVVAVSGPPST